MDKKKQDVLPTLDPNLAGKPFDTTNTDVSAEATAAQRFGLRRDTTGDALAAHLRKVAEQFPPHMVTVTQDLKALEAQDEWTSVDDALPTIPEGEQSVKVSVKLAAGDTPMNAFYLRQVGLLSCPGPGFALDFPIVGHNNRVIGKGSSSPLAPTHWRLRDA
jgi:hypothetical protein